MFFEFGIKDFIDILLAAFLLYYTYKLMKASGSIKVFTGILVFILIWLVVTQVLEMKLLGSIFDTLMNVGVIALIVLFQDEIRRFLLTLGSHRHVSALARLFNWANKYLCNQRVQATLPPLNPLKLPFFMVSPSQRRAIQRAFLYFRLTLPFQG